MLVYYEERKKYMLRVYGLVVIAKLGNIVRIIGDMTH